MAQEEGTMQQSIYLCEMPEKFPKLIRRALRALHVQNTDDRNWSNDIETWACPAEKNWISQYTAISSPSD
jgi:hypothetical protein